MRNWRHTIPKYGRGIPRKKTLPFRVLKETLRKERQLIPRSRLRTMISKQANSTPRYIRQMATRERAGTLSGQEPLDLFITPRDEAAFGLKVKSVTRLTMAIAVLLLASVALAEDRPSAKTGGGQKP